MSKRKLIVNSNLDRAPNGTSSNFQCYLSRPLESHRGKIKLGIRKAIVPNLAYNFAYEESFLWYQTDVGGAAEAVHYIEIDTRRQYNDTTDLCQHLEALFTDNGHSISVAEDTTTNRVVFTNNGTVAMRIVGDYIYETEVNGVTIVNHANKKLGIIEDTKGSSIAAGATYQATGLPKLLRTSVYHITSNKIGNQYYTATPSPYDNPKIIMSLLNDEPFGYNVTEVNDDSEIYTVEFEDGLSDFDIQIRDEEYRLVDLNGGGVYLEFDYWFV